MASTPWRQTAFALWGLILAAALGLRLYRLDHFSFGLDEILQGFWIRGTWEFFWKSLRFDAVHPPFDYLVSRAVERFEPSEWMRRLPDVIWGVAAVAAFGALVARRAARVEGLLTGLVLAVAPFHVHYSQEFRPYSLGLLTLGLSMLALDRLLDRPTPVRLGALYLACLATAYTLYLAAFVLGIAAAALLVEAAAGAEPARRSHARRFLRWSPLFAIALWLGYLPWWPTLVESIHRRAPVEAEPVTWTRLGRTLAFLAFGPGDGARFDAGTALWVCLVVAGAFVAWRRPGLRFLLVWGFGGLLATELLGQLHPHWYANRRFLPAGVAFSILAALAIATLLHTRARPAAALLLAAALALDARGLVLYFREGRVDWRPLARYLATRPASEQIFTENQYAQLCLAYYLCGPDWLFREAKGYRAVSNLECEPVRLTWAWPPGKTAWMLIGGAPRCEALRTWAGGFPATAFPTAESSVLHRLDPDRRDASLGLAH